MGYQNGAEVEILSNMVKQFGQATLPDAVLNRLRELVPAQYCAASDSVITQTIARCHEATGRVYCPHTACALAYHYEEGFVSNN